MNAVPPTVTAPTEQWMTHWREAQRNSHNQWRQSCMGVGEIATPQILGSGLWGCRGRVVKYYYILSCTKVCSKVISPKSMKNSNHRNLFLVTSLRSWAQTWGSLVSGSPPIIKNSICFLIINYPCLNILALSPKRVFSISVKYVNQTLSK